MPNQSLVEDPSVYENAGDLRHDGLPLRYQYPRIHRAWLRRRRWHRHSTLFCHQRIRLAAGLGDSERSVRNHGGE